MYELLSTDDLNLPHCYPTNSTLTYHMFKLFQADSVYICVFSEAHSSFQNCFKKHTLTEVIEAIN